MKEDDIKRIVIEDKWMAALEKDVKSEMDRVNQKLTGRIKELAERYEAPLPKLKNDTDILTKKVDVHLKKMGFKW